MISQNDRYHGLADHVDPGNSRNIMPAFDFEFDGLKPSKTYRLRITHGGYATVEKPVVTHSDVNVGVIELDPSS